MEPGSELAHEVLRTLRGISRRLEEHSKQLSRERGLTLPQLMCLKAIGEAPQPPTLVVLAGAVELSSATVSRVVERLVRAGFVDRTRGTEDRRQVRLRLTAQGKSLFDTLPEPVQARFLERLRGLPESERDALVQALRRIARLMDADEAPLPASSD